ALKGFDWSRIKPEVVMVEFMDDRSERNFNYTHHDMASFMKERGYTCFVSEWEPIVQYGIKGQIAEPHRWVQCVKYPLDHIPSWGNLIFAPEKDETNFVKTLEKYVRDVSNRESPGSFQHLVLQMKRFVKRTFFNCDNLKETIIGSSINTASPIVAEVMSASGFDFLVVDAEHSAVDMNDCLHLFQAIKAGNPQCIPMVRMPGNAYQDTKRYLDAGAMGVIAPL